MARKWTRRRDDGGSMLASLVIIVLGTGLCCFLCLMDTSDFGTVMMLSLPIASLLLILFLMNYRYGRTKTGSGLTFWFSAASNHNDDGIAAQYRPEKIKDSRSNAPAGSNSPITAQEAHELQTTSASSWVPSKKKKSRR